MRRFQHVAAAYLAASPCVIALSRYSSFPIPPPIFSSGLGRNQESILGRLMMKKNQCGRSLILTFSPSNQRVASLKSSDRRTRRGERSGGPTPGGGVAAAADAEEAGGGDCP